MARLRLPALQPPCKTPHVQLLGLFRLLCVTLPFHKHNTISWILSKILILPATLAPFCTLTTWADTFPGLGWRSNSSLILVKTNCKDPFRLTQAMKFGRVPYQRVASDVWRVQPLLEVEIPHFGPTVDTCWKNLRAQVG